MKKWAIRTLWVSALALSAYSHAGTVEGRGFIWPQVDGHYDTGELDVYDSEDFALYYQIEFAVAASAPHWLLSLNYVDPYTGAAPTGIAMEIDTAQWLGPPDADWDAWYPYSTVKTLDISGTHDTVALTPGTYFLMVSPQWFSGGAVDVTATLAPVPEPETWALLGVGAVALLARRRKLGWA